MLKYLLILLSIISVSLSQVVPNYQPYSRIHPNTELSITQLTVGDNDIYIKIIDYGTCQKKGHIELDYCCSTNGYVAPELNYEYILSHKSDIYAIGVIMNLH